MNGRPHQCLVKTNRAIYYLTATSSTSSYLCSRERYGAECRICFHIFHVSTLAPIAKPRAAQTTALLEMKSWQGGHKSINRHYGKGIIGPCLSTICLRRQNTLYMNTCKLLLEPNPDKKKALLHRTGRFFNDRKNKINQWALWTFSGTWAYRIFKSMVTCTASLALWKNLTLEPCNPCWSPKLDELFHRNSCHANDKVKMLENFCTSCRLEVLPVVWYTLIRS